MRVLVLFIEGELSIPVQTTHRLQGGFVPAPPGRPPVSDFSLVLRLPTAYGCVATCKIDQPTDRAGVPPVPVFEEDPLCKG